MDILSSRSLELLELLAAVVMQQEESERRPGDVTASAEPPGEEAGWGLRGCQGAPRVGGSPASDSMDVMSDKVISNGGRGWN